MRKNKILPLWLRRSHPVVQRYLRQPVSRHFQVLLFFMTIGLFLMLGGLSLPVMYCFFSLLILIRIATSSVDKVWQERRHATWDLMRLTPFSSRELLLSIWAASLWQINRTWMMVVYRLLHSIIIIGFLVFTLLFAEVPISQTLPVLFSGTLLIIVQPFAEMYFSGMVGLAGANHLRDQGNALGFAVGAVMLYWLVYMGGILVVLLSQQMRLTAPQLTLLFLTPTLLPLVLGYCAFRVAEAPLR